MRFQSVGERLMRSGVQFSALAFRNGARDCGKTVSIRYPQEAWVRNRFLCVCVKIRVFSKIFTVYLIATLSVALEESSFTVQLVFNLSRTRWVFREIHASFCVKNLRLS